MKSTLKIAFQSNMSPELPVIKIVQPMGYHYGKFDPSDDVDVKDEMLHSFLTQPASLKPYPIFTVKTTFPHPFEGDATHWITTIAPVQEQDVLYKLRHMVINRFVPAESIVTLNLMGEERLEEYFSDSNKNIEIPIERSLNYKKIHDFFNWLDTLEYVPDTQF